MRRLHLPSVLGPAVLAAALVTLPAPALAQRAPVETVQFIAASVGREMRYNVILPSGYADPANAERRYPTLYLLHGAGNNYLSWTRFLGVGLYAVDYEMIIVMPDAGTTWYVNWARSDDDRLNAWEDYIVRDVIGHVDNRYRTVARRDGRAITGFSMGGYGAMTIGLRHPDLFVSVGSQSGALEYARTARGRLDRGEPASSPRQYAPTRQTQREQPNPLIDLAGFSSIVDRTPTGQPFVTAAETDAHDPFALVLQIPRDQLPLLHVDCGTDDGLIGASKAFVALLLRHDIPFDYMQLGGGHDPGYWIQTVGYFMGLHHEAMQRALGRRPVAVRR
jgi:putative tributyrin esterase